MTALAILFGISQVARRWGMPSDCLKTSAYRGEGETMMEKPWENYGKMMMMAVVLVVMMMMMSNIFVQIRQVRGTQPRCGKKNSIRRYVFSWKQGQWSTLLRHVLEDSYEPVFLPEIVSPPVWQHAAGREQRMRPALFRHSSGVQSGGGKAWVSQAETGGPRGATWIS